MRQPIQTAVYCIRLVKDYWEYLLLRRIPSGGGFWQPVTGGVEDEEEYLTTAQRELKEETGFEPEDLHLIDYSYTFPVPPDMKKLYKNDVNLINEIVFLAIVESKKDPIMTPIEHDGYKWCRFEEAYDMLFWPENKESIKHCELYLKSKYKS